MTREWTKQQQAVIDFSGGNLLVSAAAGSGKTAVLVERILSRITDPEKKTDIDELLVVTFTSAAAGEMKERLTNALQERLREDEGNQRLIRQISLIPHARISTIHSFCLDIVRNHFHEAGVDPSFRIGDEGEMKLLSRDIISRVLEEEYSLGGEDFLHFVNSYVSGRDDTVLEDMVLNFYEYSLGYPWPEKWRNECLDLYRTADAEELEGAGWVVQLEKRTDRTLRAAEEEIIYAESLCLEKDGPYQYLDALEDDLSQIRRLLRAEGYDARAKELHRGIYFMALRRTGKDINPELKEQVKKIRDEVKKELTGVAEDHQEVTETLLKSMRRSAQDIGVLVRLAGRFEELFAQEKQEKNVLDFSDLEHLALKVLLTEEDGELKPSEAAKEYASYFKETMVDEYQDSNLLQELILNTVSGTWAGEHKRFMVGDVKQSIYRFRQARPEIFIGKYAQYQKELDSDRKIDLNRNFRSREQVLSFVNHIFETIMSSEMGGVDYDEDASLYPGSEQQKEKEDFLIPEILLTADPSPEDGEDGENEDSGDRLAGEAAAVAGAIREIVGNEYIRDPVSGVRRPVEYGDIAVLMRSVAIPVQTFSRVFDRENIPYYTGGGTGYFSAPEVRTMLNYLSIVDNPRQDIPLAGVLRSVIGYLTDEELAQIRCAYPRESLYEAAVSYCESRQDAAAEKLRVFFDVLGEIRADAEQLSIHELLYKISDRTGYGAFVLSMPGGLRRKANLDMLSEKAEAFEAGSYQGLFQFIRYIEELYKYEIDYGEALPGGGVTGSVRLMTIHKSKGLEFPVVFVCGLGRRFNRQDSSGAMILHPLYGVGTDYVDTETRIRHRQLIRRVLAKEIRLETLGEELRVLYVAMTRAREKLYLTGTPGDLEKKMEAWSSERIIQDSKLKLSAREGANCFLDWIMPAVLADEQSGRCRVRIVRSREKSGSDAGVKKQREQIPEPQKGRIYDEAWLDMLKKAFRTGGEESESLIPLKISVSDIKKEQAQEEEAREFFAAEEAGIPTLHLDRTDEGGGAERGTLYHLVMENLRFDEDFDANFLGRQLERLVKYGKIHKDQLKMIRRDQLEVFLHSDLAKRMRQAAGKGLLHRESPFVIAVRASEISDRWDSDEQVLIQGIIDAWFEEDEGIVLLDYKTDRVENGEQLINRYAVQLSLYARALEQLTGKKVREKLIYSFRLGETIPLA